MSMERIKVWKTVVDCEIRNLEQFAQVITETLCKYRAQYDSGDLDWEVDCNNDDDYWTFTVAVHEYETDAEYAERLDNIARKNEMTRERDLEHLAMFADRLGMKVVPKE